jgi:serine/threonine protein kinase
MRVICPSCAESIEVQDGAAVLLCETCGMEADVSQLVTSPGVPSPAVTRDLTGGCLGHYELEALIGVGGMGVVYRARRQSDGETVAVKVLNAAAFLKKEELSARFKREVKALERLEHPGIVRILDSGEEGDTHFLVTEYVPGMNLAEHMRATQPDPVEIVGIMIKVLDAIHYAHDNGIVHRDIKPANIIVHGSTVKVLDFGLAQIAGADTGLSTLTRTNLALGTFNYLSPEQRTNAKAVDERADIFSLGVVFYELLTGALPLGNFEPPSRAAKNLGKRYDRVVETSLRADPDRRYQNVEAFSADLERLRRPRMRFLPYAAAGLLVLLIGLGIATTTALMAPPPETFELTGEADKGPPVQEAKPKSEAAETQAAPAATQRAIPPAVKPVEPIEPPPQKEAPAEPEDKVTQAQANKMAPAAEQKSARKKKSKAKKKIEKRPTRTGKETADDYKKLREPPELDNAFDEKNSGKASSKMKMKSANDSVLDSISVDNLDLKNTKTTKQENPQFKK